jgi:hypothetical protein
MSRTEKATPGNGTRSSQVERLGGARALALSRALGRVQGDAVSDCRCGQELDMCARAHCPRCGRSISQA